MRGLTIQFDSDPELPVVVVQVTCPSAHPADRLPLRAGESMTAFDVANIMPFQYRVNAVANIGKRADQFGAPAQPRPGRHRIEEELGRGQSSPAGAGQPR